MNATAKCSAGLTKKAISHRQLIAIETLCEALSDTNYVPPKHIKIHMPPRPANSAECSYYWDVTVLGNSIDRYHNDTTYTITVQSIPQGGYHLVLDITNPDIARDELLNDEEQSEVGEES